MRGAIATVRLDATPLVAAICPAPPSGLASQQLTVSSPEIDSSPRPAEQQRAVLGYSRRQPAQGTPLPAARRRARVALAPLGHAQPEAISADEV